MRWQDTDRKDCMGTQQLAVCAAINLTYELWVFIFLPDWQDFEERPTFLLILKGGWRVPTENPSARIYMIKKDGTLVGSEVKFRNGLACQETLREMICWKFFAIAQPHESFYVDLDRHERHVCVHVQIAETVLSPFLLV